MTCNIEEFSEDIIFRHELSEKDRLNLRKRCYDNIVESKNLLDFSNFNCYRELERFFERLPGKYFIRLSTRSPKDSWHYINEDIDFYEKNELDDKDYNCNVNEVDGKSENEIEDEYTLEDIKRNIESLKVSSAFQCLQILTHSERVYEDMFQENAIILLRWRDINYQTETRCFFYGNRLLAFSQYYKIPSRGINVNDIFQKTLEFFKNNVIKYRDCIVDLHFPENENVNRKAEIVEYNPYIEETDACFFSWKEIHELETYQGSKEVKYRFEGGFIKN